MKENIMSDNWVDDIEGMHHKFGVDEWFEKNKHDKELMKKFIQFRMLMIYEELGETMSAINNSDSEEIVDGLIDLCVFAIGTLDIFKVDANAGKPQIAYRETMLKSSEGNGKFIRQSGGRGQYGHAVIKMEPLEKGKGVELENKIVGGSIPKEFIKPTFDGIKEAALSGVVAGYPVIDFKITLFDGSFHDVDSSEMAFKMAGIFAFKDAMKNANPILLEPIMKVEVSTPEEYQGELMGDLNRRRGQIQGMEAQGNACLIQAFVPLENMFGYSTDMRSLSSGRADYSMTPSHFEQVPQSLVQSIVETLSREPART